MFFGASHSVVAKTVINVASKAETKLLEVTDLKYQKDHGIHLQIKKTIVSSILGSTKVSEGEAWLNMGQMRLEIHKPEPSKIIADKSYLWIESPAPKGFKEAQPQVLKASLKSKQAQSQGLIQMLTGGGLLKYFKVAGVQRLSGQVIYFLQPENQAVEFKRAQITVGKKAQVIDELKYWDQMDNETSYRFTKTEFHQKIKTSKFDYIPPKNAKVIVY